MTISKQWELIPIEKRKLVKSFAYGVIALGALAVADYLKQFGLPEQVSWLAPFLPVVINFLQKWSQENKY